MKVMYILDSLNRGGAEMLVLDVCRNARANNLDLTLVAMGGGDLEKEFARSGVPFFRLNRRRPLDLRLVRALRSLIQENEIQIIHAHQAVEMLHGYLATRRNPGVKLIMTFHLCTADAKNRLALQLLTPRVDANIAVSHQLYQCLKNEAGLDTSHRFHVIHNGVDRRRLKSSGNHVREELRIPADAFVAGMVGNFYADQRKDQPTICRSLPHLFSNVRNAHFIFIGDDVGGATEMQKCIALCRELNVIDRVHFLRKRSDIPDLLESLDIYVHSSVNESHLLAVIEAMLLGLPVVVSDIGALLEVTGSGECAVTFKTGDAADLAGKLIPLVKDHGRRSELAQRAKEFAIKNFTIERHIAQLLELYASL